VNILYKEKVEANSTVERNIAKLMLNSLYGKFGMKDIYNNLKIVSPTEADKITKKYNYNLFVKLSNGKIMIKYSSRISPNLTSLYINPIKIKESNILEGLYKERGVSSAIQIACAIAGYSKVSTHKFKNITDNPLIYTDTDSFVLSKDLNEKFIGKNLGQMKLENKIKEGIFAGKKLYCIIDYNNKQIIKASGIDSKKLNYSDFKELITGTDITTTREKFKLD